MGEITLLYNFVPTYLQLDFNELLIYIATFEISANPYFYLDGIFLMPVAPLHSRHYFFKVGKITFSKKQLDVGHSGLIC